jgi:hypothetical protein
MLEKLKRKQKHRQKMAMFQSILKTALTDPLSDAITPMPYSPAEPAPIGMLDGIYPQEDRESKPISSLDYGVLETHMADDGKHPNGDPIDNLEYFKQKPARTSFRDLVEKCVVSGWQNVLDEGVDTDTPEGYDLAIASAEMLAIDKANDHNRSHPEDPIDRNDLASAVRGEMMRFLRA